MIFCIWVWGWCLVLWWVDVWWFCCGGVGLLGFVIVCLLGCLWFGDLFCFDLVVVGLVWGWMVLVGVLRVS